MAFIFFFFIAVKEGNLKFAMSLLLTHITVTVTVLWFIRVRLEPFVGGYYARVVMYMNLKKLRVP